jgi:hypothetical protein
MYVIGDLIIFSESEDKEILISKVMSEKAI